MFFFTKGILEIKYIKVSAIAVWHSQFLFLPLFKTLKKKSCFDDMWHVKSDENISEQEQWVRRLDLVSAKQAKQQKRQCNKRKNTFSTKVFTVSLMTNLHSSVLSSSNLGFVLGCIASMVGFVSWLRQLHPSVSAPVTQNTAAGDSYNCKV